MSDLFKNYGILLNNPFRFAPVFYAFYENLSDPKENNYFLSFLVLPIILKSTRLAYAKNVSKITSIFDVTDLRKRDVYYGLQDRIVSYNSITKDSLQYAFDNNYIILNDDLSIGIGDCRPLSVKGDDTVIKRAEKLGMIFNKYTVVEIFKMFNLKKI